MRNTDAIPRKLCPYRAGLYFELEDDQFFAAMLDQISVGGNRARHDDEEVNTRLGVSHNRFHLTKSTIPRRVKVKTSESNSGKGLMSLSGQTVDGLHVETRGLRATRMRSLNVIWVNPKIEHGP